jgi:transcriptional regulator with XRE-family HTH domain
MRTALDVDGLRRELARRGMTSAELAAVAGLSEATVSHGMNHHRVSYTTVRKLARALSVTPVLPNADTFLLERTPALENENAATGSTPAAATGVGVAATNSHP